MAKYDLRTVLHTSRNTAPFLPAWTWIISVVVAGASTSNI